MKKVGVAILGLLQKSSLLEVTTDLPAFNAESTKVFAGSTPPITSTNVTTVATGGFSEVIAKEVTCIDHVDKLLTLRFQPSEALRCRLQDCLTTL